MMCMFIIRNSSSQFIEFFLLYSPSGHPRCRWVCFFIWKDLEKFSITSQMVPLQWMGAVRMRVQTADKNHNNPHHSSPSIMWLWTTKQVIRVICKKKIYIYTSSWYKLTFHWFGHVECLRSEILLPGGGGGTHRGQTRVWSADYHVKRNHIQSESELTEAWQTQSWRSTKGFGHYYRGRDFFFSNLIYCHLYISLGLMFSSLVIFQDICKLFISKLYLVLLL